MIEAVCVCGKRIQAQDEHAGLSIKCPKCRKLVVVPTAATPGEPPAPAPVPEREPEPEAVEAFWERARATTAMDAPRTDDGLVKAIERLTAVCLQVRTLLAVALAVLILQLLIALAEVFVARRG